MKREHNLADYSFVFINQSVILLKHVFIIITGEMLTARILEKGDKKN